MQVRITLAVALSLLSLSLPNATSQAAEVLKNVPNDAHGFVIFRNLEKTNANINELLKVVQSHFPGPLTFLQAATGISEGLDPQGDLLLVVYPGKNAEDARVQFAVWLPVGDYDHFVSTLGGDSTRDISAVTLAGEDVLIARHGDWALVMDPGQRQRMQQMLTQPAKPLPAIAEWNQWVNSNDIAAVALPAGVRAMQAWLSPAAYGNRPDSNRQPDMDLFSSDADSSPERANTLRSAIGQWTTASPRLSRALSKAHLVGIALRLDETGNLLAGLRLNGGRMPLWNGDLAPEISPTPPTLYQAGPFVVNGAGNLSPEFYTIAADLYMRAVVNELQSEERMVLRDTTVRQFHQAIEGVAAEIVSVAVLTQPGSKQEPIYTNDYLVLRTTSAEKFTESAKDAMRLWNTMNRDAEAEMRLVFDVEEVPFGTRTATKYSLDIAAADGAPELPEIRQAMEKFFGAGGKLRLWIVPVDDSTVLLASATPEQIAAALETLDQEQKVGWSAPEISPVNQLLPADASLRLFFSPQHYNGWYRRQMDAITGPVIGGPLVEEFPTAPPVGIAAGVHDGNLWIDTVVPHETLKAAGIYLKK